MSIENVQLRVAELKTRMASKLAAPNAKFQQILKSKMGTSSTQQSQASAAAAEETTATESTVSATVVAPSTAVTQTPAAEAAQTPATSESASGTATGRYCSYCGVPELTTDYMSRFAAAVDTSDGMIEKAASYMSIMEEASQTYGIPVNLIMGVIKAESDFNPKCTSSSGAMGLMQIMPVNAEEFGVTDSYDPKQNIFCGTEEIARHLKNYNGDLKLALAAYNTGAGNIARKGITSSSSSQYNTLSESIRQYVDRVIKYAGITL